MRCFQKKAVPPKLKANKVKKNVWDKSVDLAGGNKDKAKASYVKFREKELRSRQFGKQQNMDAGEHTMQALVFIAYIILGLCQLAAVMAGLEVWIGLHWIIAAPLAFFIAYIPLVGTIVGMFGAVTAWHWSWVQAGGLFFGPFAVIVVMAMGAGVLEKFSNRS